MKKYYDEICAEYVNKVFNGKSFNDPRLTYQNLEFAKEIYNFFGAEGTEEVEKNARDALKVMERDGFTDREILTARASGRRDAKKEIEKFLFF